MDITYLTVVKSLLIVIIFFIMVRFIFTSSREEQEYKLSPKELKEEIEDIKKNMKFSQDTHHGELMDSLMEEYYSSEKKS